MKEIKLILGALTSVILASCGGESTKATEPATINIEKDLYNKKWDFVSHKDDPSFTAAELTEIGDMSEAYQGSVEFKKDTIMLFNSVVPEGYGTTLEMDLVKKSYKYNTGVHKLVTLNDSVLIVDFQDQIITYKVAK